LRYASDFHKKLIVQKFLRANANDLEKARNQLLETLKWRKSFNALHAKDETFSRARFGGLGYVVKLKGVPESLNEQDFATFNIYGAVTDNGATFADLTGFLRWRVGVMELTLARLEMERGIHAIADYG